LWKFSKYCEHSLKGLLIIIINQNIKITNNIKKKIKKNPELFITCRIKDSKTQNQWGSRGSKAERTSLIPEQSYDISTLT